MSPTALSSTMLKERIARGFLWKGWAFLECSFVGVGGAWGDDRAQRRGNSRQPIRNPGRMTTLFCYFFFSPSLLRPVVGFVKGDGLRVFLFNVA